MAKNKYQSRPKRQPAARNIPYHDRLIMEKYNTVYEQRDDSAKIALKVACVALNDTEGLGLVRISRFGERFQELIQKYYSDPEVQEKHLNDRLQQMGFGTARGGVQTWYDEAGNPIPIQEAKKQMQEREARE